MANKTVVKPRLKKRSVVKFGALIKASNLITFLYSLEFYRSLYFRLPYLFYSSLVNCGCQLHPIIETSVSGGGKS